jgi:DnaA-like protein
MFIVDYRATERGIRERRVHQIIEPQEVPPPRTWQDIVDEKERRRVEAIEQQRTEGLRLLRRNGMPEWALAILIGVADRHAICPSDIASRKRDRPIIEARREAAYLIKAKKPELSGPQLGKWFGKDHTSISHLIACYQVEHDAPKLVGYDLARHRLRNNERTKLARKTAASL